MNRRLLLLVRPYRRQVALAVLLGVVTVAGNMGQLGMAAYLVAASALKPLWITLAVPITVVQSAGVLRAVSRYAERLVSHDLTFRLLAAIRTAFFAKLVPLAPGRLLAFHSGDLLSRLVTDLEELQNLYVRALAPLLVAGITLVVTTALLAAFGPLLGGTVLAFLLLAGVVVPLVLYRLSGTLADRQLTAQAELKTRLIDGVEGLADLLAFGCVDAHAARIAAIDKGLETLQGRMARISGLQQALSLLIPGLATVTTVAIATPLIRSGRLPAVDLALLAVLTLVSFEAITPVAMALQHLGRSFAAGRRLFEVADLAPTVLDTVDPRPLTFPADLHFDNVSFRYDGAEPTVLQGISFTVPARGRIAIVGASGSGKSTLASLAVRLWDPTCGTIRLGDHALSDYALDSVRAHIGLVSQNPYLFSDTLRQNLLLGRPDATGEELRQALRLVRLDDLVARLPEGLDTWIGAEGMRLSGGERQRVAIARALLKASPLLILDEATANLDPLTEQDVLREIALHTTDRALLVISHRLVGMDAMDEILVLDRGRIVERGTHAELARSDGWYSSMLRLQNETIPFGESPRFTQPLEPATPVGPVVARG